MFERKAYSEMLKWKKEYAPDYALFLKGARRTGKTTLAEKLGKEEYRSYILIRFDQVEEEIKNLFVNSQQTPCVFLQRNRQRNKKDNRRNRFPDTQAEQGDSDRS